MLAARLPCRSVPPPFPVVSGTSPPASPERSRGPVPHAQRGSRGSREISAVNSAQDGGGPGGGGGAVSTGRAGRAGSAAAPSGSFSARAWRCSLPLVSGAASPAAAAWGAPRRLSLHLRSARAGGGGGAAPHGARPRSLRL